MYSVWGPPSLHFDEADQTRQIYQLPWEDPKNETSTPIDLLV